MSRPPGFVVWLTGLVGAGKSTIARELAAVLAERGYPVEVLDGRRARQALSRGLGFSREDRVANAERLGFVAHLLARHGVVAIVAAVSPYHVARAAARERIGRFVEVYVRCPIEELVRRDTSGLYSRALGGELPAFTGVSDPYEEPLDPEVIVETDRQSVAAGVELIVKRLEALGYLPGPTQAVPAGVERAREDDAATRGEAEAVIVDHPLPGQVIDPPPDSARAGRRARVPGLRKLIDHLRTQRAPARRAVTAGPSGREPDAALVEGVAEALYRRSIREGGWALEIGGMGPGAFVPEATEAINAIALGRAEQGPPTP